MNIKNYTTQVPVVRSIENIELLLVKFGATNIMKQYEGGMVKAISFLITIDTMPFAFKLPADVKACYVWLKKQQPKRNDKNLLEQAARIAWKHQHEWLHIQLTSIMLSQLEKLQALLPYVYDPNTNATFYDKLKEQKFQNLLPSTVSTN